MTLQLFGRAFSSYTAKARLRCTETRYMVRINRRTPQS